MQIKAINNRQTEDFTLPHRYWKSVKRKEFIDPERQLMLAIQKDAIMHYKRYRSKQDRRFRDARKWLFDGDAVHVFSIKYICSVFGLSVDKIRGRLLADADALEI